MNLEASIALGAGEERIEREDGPIRREDGALRFGGVGSGCHGPNCGRHAREERKAEWVHAGLAKLIRDEFTKAGYKIQVYGRIPDLELGKRFSLGEQHTYQHPSGHRATVSVGIRPKDNYWAIQHGSKGHVSGKLYELGKVRKLLRSQVAAAAGGQGGWQYGFRHSVGYVPQRTLSGMPKLGKVGHTPGVPAIPRGPGVARKPNPSMGQKQFKGPGLLKPTHSLRSKSEAAEPPVGAYSRENDHEQDHWFDDPIKEEKMKAGGVGSGCKGPNCGRPKKGEAYHGTDVPSAMKILKEGIDPKKSLWNGVAFTTDSKQEALVYSSGKDQRALVVIKPGALANKLRNNDGETRSLIPASEIDRVEIYHAGELEKVIDTSKVNRLKPVKVIKADFDGEPSSTMQHAHLSPIDTYHPPSLVKRRLQDHVPVDDVGETDNKWLDVDKRNSKGTWEERMKLLKRSAPGGAPALIPARTTLLPTHQGSYLPSAMMSAQRIRPNQRPVNWNKQPRSFTSYDRRGSI